MSDAANEEIPVVHQEAEGAVVEAPPPLALPEIPPTPAPLPYPGFWQAVWIVARYFLFQSLAIAPFAIIDWKWKTQFSRHPAVFALATLLAGIFSTRLVCSRMSVTFRDVAGPWVGGGMFSGIVTIVLGAIFAEMPIVIWIGRAFPKLLNVPDFGVSKSLWAGFLLIVVVAPIVEETTFRGIITKGFMGRYGATKAILFSGLMFGAVHFSLVKLVTTVSLGLLLGWLYVRFGSIWPGVFAHAFNNSLGFLAMAASGMKRGGTMKPELGHFSWGEPVIVLVGLLMVYNGVASLRRTVITS